MTKILLLLSVLLVLSCAFLSCEDGECEHDFIPATCKSLKTCVKCGDFELGFADHVWKDATCNSAKTCEVCSLTEGAPLSHEWSSTACTDDKLCTLCGKTETATAHIWDMEICEEPQSCLKCGFKSGALAHDLVSPTCTSAGFCTRCNMANGEALGHDWQITTCKNPKTCQRCNATSTEGLPHEWTYQGCDRQRLCSICSQGEGFEYGHKWIEATCVEAKHCENCKETVGALANHEWQSATCELAQRCKNCEKTVGIPLGHDWEFFATVEPLCEKGKDVYACTRCDSRKEESTKDAKYGYHICELDGTCIQCNEVYDTEKMILDSVLIANEHSVEFCGIFTSAEAGVKIYKSITSKDVGMPVVDLGGSLPTSKGYTNTVDFVYDANGLYFSCTAQITVQGASSASKPKKNFNIKFFNSDGSKFKVELCDGWGKENKYCLKANYIDYSQSRNVVSGKIFGEIVKSRNDELSDTPNGGVIDGYPILVYNNGVYQGIYTMNIPKDNWMLGMSHSDEKNQAIFMAETWNNAVSFRQISTSGFTLEYASNEDSLIDKNTQWAYDSLRDLIEFVYYNDGEDFKNGIHQYADIDKCIDSMIYTFFICADDNTSKNILWVTLDGKVWFSSMYDMDGTWGMRWNGNIEFNEYTHPISALVDGKGLAPERNHSNLNLLWERIYVNYFDRVCERYAELRQEILTEENITNHFESFFNSIPDVVREAERKKWTGVPSQNVDHLTQILTFARKRLVVMDDILLLQE